MKLIYNVKFLLILLIFNILITCCSNSLSVPTPIIPLNQKNSLKYENLTIIFSKNVTEEQKKDIKKGIKIWFDSFLFDSSKYISSQIIMFNIVNSYNLTIVNQEKLSQNKKTVTLGLTQKISESFSKIYIVNDRINDRISFVNIVAHEFGHVLGLNHTNDKKSIMNKLYYSDECAGCITKVDAYELCKHINCNVQNIKTCN